MRDFSSYRQTFNTKIYGVMVTRVVKTTDDYYWLCNQMASLYQEVEYAGCVDAPRVSKDEKGGWSHEFQATISCCGCTNRKVTNPATNNQFWIGFNYGH